MEKVLFIWFRRFVMMVVPFLLVLLEWNHPSGFSKNVYEGLHHMSSWWKELHILQSFLFGAVALAAMLLTFRQNNFFGIVSKFFIWLFAVCYLVFDSTAGIAVGYILDLPNHHPNIDVESTKNIVQLLYTDPIIGGSGSAFSLAGSYGWLLGISFAIISIFLTNRRLGLKKLLPPLILLAISAYTLYVGHYAPYGPIAFGSFLLAAIWFDIFNFDL